MKRSSLLPIHTLEKRSLSPRLLGGVARSLLPTLMVTLLAVQARGQSAPPDNNPQLPAQTPTTECPSGTKLDPEALAAAAVLFDNAAALETAGNIHDACENLLEAARQASTYNILVQLGACYESLGKWASAWAANRLAHGKMAINDPERHKIEATVTRLRARLSLVRVVQPTPSVVGLRVTVDARSIRNPLLGADMPLDPGDHTIVAEAPAKQKWTQRISVPSYASQQTVVIQMGDEEQAPPPQPLSDGWRTSAAVLQGSGITALAIAAGLGVVSFALDSKSDRECPNGSCTEHGFALSQQAKTTGTIAWVTGAVGAAALGAGLALYFTATPLTTASDKTGRAKLDRGGAMSSIGIQGVW